MKKEFLTIIKEIGEQKFRKNVVEWEPNVDWASMSLTRIVEELIAFEVDPSTFEY